MPIEWNWRHINQQETDLGINNNSAGLTKTVRRFAVGRTKGNPRLCRGNKKALAESKEIKKDPPIEKKWFADHTSTIERDSN